MSNQILPFCPTDTGTNILDPVDYAADSQRLIGNQPGIARSALNNTPLRQSSFVVSQLAQYMVNKLGISVLDDADTTKLLAQMTATLTVLPPVFNKYTSGSGTHNCSIYFFIASGSASAGATYTNNSVTFTVAATVASATLIRMTGNGSPTISGTLTKASGTGDATLTFYAMRAPRFIDVEGVGGGGGGAGGGSSGQSGGATGGSTLFGTSLIVAAGGSGGTIFAGVAQGGAVGGGINLGGLAGIAVQGNGGGSGYTGNNGASPGAGSVFGGGGPSGSGNASTNSGGGGGGGAATNSAANTGGGGASGGWVRARITSPLMSYNYSVGGKGIGGGAGTNGAVGGDGADGVLLVNESF